MMTQFLFNSIPMPEAGTPEWHEKRRTSGIGASECAAVLGLSKWVDPLEIYLLKRGLITPSESTRPMRRGNHMEPFIMSEFEMETGFKGFKPDFMAKSVKYDWLFTNLDWVSVSSPDECAEFKSSDASSEWGESGSQDVPEAYYIQCQHTLLVTGCTTCWLAAMLPYGDLRIYPITPNKAVWEHIIAETKAFWDNVQAGIAPTEKVKADSVKKLYPTVEEKKVVELPEDTATRLLTRHLEVKEQIETLTTEKERLEGELLMLTGDAQKAIVPGWKGSITRSVTKPSTFTVNRKGGILCRINHPKHKGE